MISRNKVLLAAGLLAAAGAAAAVYAQAPQGGGRDGRPGMMGRGMGPGMGRSFSQDEFDARTRERFARMDKNGDGSLDLAEIEAALTADADQRRGRMGMGGPGQNPGQRMLRLFDENKDGKVTREEFLGTVRKQFAEMDLNNDGRISDDDLPPMMRGRNVLAGGGQGMGPGGGMGRGRGPGMGRGDHSGLGMMGPMWGLIREAGVDKDGAVTREAVLAAAARRFEGLDRSRDGALDQADADAMRKDMTDYRVKRFVHGFGADKEGKVTREQFYAKAKERFARLDWNGDGRIDGDEAPFRGMGRRGDDGRGGMMGGMRERMQRFMGRGPGEHGPGGPGGPGGAGGQGPDRGPPPPKQ
jgi:Ca2+-binding EF-hand superfamily protein